MSILRYFILFLVSFAGTGLFAEDWPTWRHDANRTGCTTEKLSDDLELLWRLDLPTPKPCWSLSEYRLQFDHSYEPVVLGNRVFVPSMVNDSVSSYDLASGERQWTFYADGPVRFAPLGWKDKLYVASDDGYLYCLNAASGAVIWKFRGGTTERRLLGNRRLINLYPVRGAPVIYDEKIYFAAGIWPFMGIFIHALDAQTGEVVWSNSGDGADFQLQPHTSPAFAGVAPQGYLIADETRLIVAGGRSAPATYDRATGAFMHLDMDDKRGSYAISSDDQNVYLDNTIYSLESGKFLGEVDFSILDEQYLVGVNQNGAIRLADKQVAKQPKIKIRPQQRHGHNPQATVLWEGPENTELEKLFLKAGDRVYGGKKNLVVSAKIPELFSSKKSGLGAVDWQQDIEGTPFNMLAANGKLLVVTEEGPIYCFGPPSARSPHIIPYPKTPLPKAIEKWDTHARQLIKECGVNDGYALVIGVGSGALIQSLLANSDLQVIGIDDDSEKIAKLRKQFDAAGLYGSRLTLLPKNIFTTPLPPYTFNLVTSELLPARAEKEPGAFAKIAYQVLRPYGGLAALPLASASDGNIRQLLALNFSTETEILRADQLLKITRHGPLKGAGSWTHQYGNAANTVASDDSHTKGPLGLLWFGGPSGLDVLPRHAHGPPEQVVGGRLFIQGISVISARDVYTGRTLWRRNMPELDTFGMYYTESYIKDPFSREGNQRHFAGANQYGTNFVATKDRLYLHQKDRCIVMDPRTGKTLAEFVLPPEENGKHPTLGFIAVVDDFLIETVSPIKVSYEGTNQKKSESKEKSTKKTPLPVNTPAIEDASFSDASRALIVRNRYTGEVLWSRKAALGFRHNAIAIGDGKIYCLDAFSPAKLKHLSWRGITPDSEGVLYALDLQSGKEIWSDTQTVFGTWLGYSTEYHVLLQGGSAAGDRAKDEVAEGMAVYQGENGTLLWRHHNKYAGPPIIHHHHILVQTGGSTLAASPVGAYDLLTGKEVTKIDPLTGNTVPWKWVRFKGCNTAIASDHLLTFRSASAAYVDLTNDGQSITQIGGFKSGCTANLIVADGVLNAPDYTRTCTCSYQNQTSLALVNLSELNMDHAIEAWSFLVSASSTEPRAIRTVGINFAGGGNRRSPNGTLWMEMPNVGGPSPDIPLAISGEYTLHRRHPSTLIETGNPNRLDWVGASYIEGAVLITLHPFLQPEKSKTSAKIEAYKHHFGTTFIPDQLGEMVGKYNKAKSHTLYLHFAEPQAKGPGERVFDILVQGKVVKRRFDIFAEAKGANKTLRIQIQSVDIRDNLTLELRPTRSTSLPPLISGLELLID